MKIPFDSKPKNSKILLKEYVGHLAIIQEVLDVFLHTAISFALLPAMPNCRLYQGFLTAYLFQAMLNENSKCWHYEEITILKV